MLVVFHGPSPTLHDSHSTGGQRQGAPKGRQGFDIWNLPAAALQDLPSLKALPLELSQFAASYLCKSLGLPQPDDVHGRWSVEELNSILLKNLVEENRWPTH